VVVVTGTAYVKKICLLRDIWRKRFAGKSRWINCSVWELANMKVLGLVLLHG